jgi:hypothetical protein
VLQPGSLKLGSCKFNVIINIINITFRLGVAAKFKNFEYSFEYSFTEKLSLLNFSFFHIFFIKKKPMISRAGHRSYEACGVGNSHFKVNSH